MNKVILVGRLTNAPQARATQSGVSVCRFSLAVTRRADREKADFINIVAWRGLADTCAKYLVKGQRVAVSGEIRTGSYTKQDGTTGYSFEVYAEDMEFLERPAGSGNRPADAFANEAGGIEILNDEELPF